MKEKIKYKNIAVIIAAIILLLAIPSIWPYGYYQFLRLAITAIAIFVAYLAYELEKKSWMWLMAVIAILFNPIIPFYLDKEIWVVIDIIVATIFLISLRLKANNE